MLRAFAVALTILFVTGFGAASAQSGKSSCEAVCLKRCAPGNVSYNQSTCMSKCVQVCYADRQTKK